MLPGSIRPLEGPPEARGELLLRPVACQHVAMSGQLIEAVMRDVRPGRALVVGAGACREIPLAALAQRFETVVLQDQDADALAGAVARIDGAPSAAAVTIEVCDLTGATDALVAGAADCLARAATPAQAIAGLCALAGAARFAAPSPQPVWDLVISSCVGTQLHLRALDEIARRFAQRFGGHGALLSGSAAWTDAMLRLSWRWQDAFHDHLLRLVDPDGRVYLSETVQVGELRACPDGWRTPGWYRMTRERLLAAVLPASALPLHGGQWPYVVAAPTAGAPGLMYNVHAVVMARRR